MAEMMQVDLVSPERRLASVEATAVRIPGADGDLTAMPDHAPMVTTLRPGVLRIETGGGTMSYAVTGGFVDISGPAATILAERAMPVEEVTSEIMDQLMSEATSRYEDARQDNPDVIDSAAKLVSDMVAMRDEIRIDSNQPNL